MGDNMAWEKLYLINDDLYDDVLIEQIIEEGKDRQLCVCHEAYTVGVAYSENGEYIAYLNNERAVVEEYQMYKTFKEAILGSRQLTENLSFEKNYCKRKLGK